MILSSFAGVSQFLLAELKHSIAWLRPHETMESIPFGRPPGGLLQWGDKRMEVGGMELRVSTTERRWGRDQRCDREDGVVRQGSLGNGGRTLPGSAYLY